MTGVKYLPVLHERHLEISPVLQVLQVPKHDKHFEFTLLNTNPSLQVSHELTEDLQSIQLLTVQAAQPDPLIA